MIFRQEENRRSYWLAIVFVTFTLFVPSSLAQTTPSSQAAPSANPSYKQLRYEEDWSFLRDPAGRDDVLDRIKYIPLGDKEDWYLTIGGEARMQFETSWAYIFAGRFLKETIPGRNLDYITARVTYKF